jgi:hypothetical protein
VSTYDTEAFITGYEECAVWSSTYFAEDGSDTPMDEVDAYLSDKAKEAMRRDCEDFVQANLADLEACGLSAEHSGHNFWLTRNGHGAGFWDRCYDPELPEYAPLQRLSKASKLYGSCDLFAHSFNENGEEGVIDIM